MLGGTERLASGLMAATGAPAVLEGHPVETLRRGDHVVVVVEVERAEVHGGEPLVYVAGEYRGLTREA